MPIELPEAQSDKLTISWTTDAIFGVASSSLMEILAGGFHITAALVAGRDDRSPPVAEGLAAFALSCP
jgi:hypothetical protein